jgi:hypothetical protein
MKTITYDKDGIEFPDHKVEEAARDFLLSTDTQIEVSNELYITAVRTLIHEEVIVHTEVRFRFVDQEGREHLLYPNAGGRMSEWPVGFCDAAERLLLRLLASPQESNEDE